MFFLVEIQKPDWNKKYRPRFLSMGTSSEPVEMGTSYFLNREINCDHAAFSALQITNMTTWRNTL
jgi:hypothetical protein